MADSTTSYTVELSHVLQDLKEKFKHGEHITRILEGQLETAQQNISLLQGQVRLANETIDNLKQQFKSSENAVFFLLENSDRLAKDHGIKVNANKSNGTRTDYSESNNREDIPSSPKSVIILQKDGSHEYVMSSSASASITAQQSNPDKPKSPYAQQLRQVLDILQNEEPARKKTNSTNNYCQSNDDYSPHCHCPECSTTPSHRHTPTSAGYLCKSSLSCTCAYHTSSASQVNERERTKEISPWSSSPKITNGLDNSHSNGDIRITSSQKGSHSQHHNGRGSPARPSSGHSQCGCSGSDSASKYSMNERSHSQSGYYTTPCNEGNLRRSESNGSGCKMPCNADECNDNCGCNSYNTYSTTPYSYQMLDSTTSGHSVHSPLESASRKRKRSLPMLQLDDPPHLKYTKVKRIDGSKLTAQKTIADFSKRRYLPCNPRFDLDLLIVPPPLAASELLNRDNKSIHQQLIANDSSPHATMTTQSSETVKIVKPGTYVSREGSIVSVLSNESTIDHMNTRAESRSPDDCSTTSDDTRLVVVENNNVHHNDHEQTNHHKSSVCDITSSKIPHFMNPLPPSLSTKS